MGKPFWLTLLAGVSALLFLGACAGRVGPEGRVRCICVGDVVDQYGGFNSFVVIRFDPAIDATLVPSRPDYLGSYENALRNMRIYMPRSYARLADSFDLIVTSDADRMIFSTEWIEWMSRSVTSGGLGLEWLGSIQSNSFPSWEGTTLAEIAPCSPGPDLDVSQAFRVSIVDPGEELMAALPWEDSPPLGNVNTQIPKEGSREWARVRGPTSAEHPLMTFWRRGKGNVLCFASKFPNGVDSWARGWDYFSQAMIYLVYRTCDRELPPDPLLFASVIGALEQYGERASTVSSVFAFVERFGGRLDRLYEIMDEIALEKAQADLAYLNGDYVACLDILDGARSRQISLMDDAMEAKDMALFWVYVTEWCAMTGTFLVSGAILWALMVRRRLYREVGVSRLAG
jgi:hypothetical protein